MTELEQLLIGDGAAAAPADLLEGLTTELAMMPIQGAPHTIYQELWHIAFWQQITLDWIQGVETPFPAHASAGFPNQDELWLETWDQLRERFFRGVGQAAWVAQSAPGLDQSILCPSRPGLSPRTMTVREQLENLAVHNAYHFGRIVLLRQLLQSWPPPKGGYTW